jgi:hypothetical protein
MMAILGILRRSGWLRDPALGQRFRKETNGPPGHDADDPRHVPCVQVWLASGTGFGGQRFRKEIANGRLAMEAILGMFPWVQVPVGFWDPAEDRRVCRVSGLLKRQGCAESASGSSRATETLFSLQYAQGASWAERPLGQCLRELKATGMLFA